MQDQHALQQGTILDRYKIIRVLGEGGFGITYLAQDIQLDLEVVIKEYFPNEFAMRSGDSTIRAKSKSVGDFSKGMQRFKEEAKTLAKFNHLAIVKILGYFEANDTAYFVMEYEEGIDLSKYLKKENRALSQDEILSIMMPILEGLKEVHKYNYLHRDIKPGNILLRTNKSPVLIDFGATKLALGEASKSITSMLTEGYAPLEQYSTDVKRQGPFTDIYAVAAVMYKMITGEVPPSAQTRSYALLSDDDDPLKVLSDMNLSSYDKSFLNAIDRALSIKGKDRPQDVQEFQADIAGNLKVDSVKNEQTLKSTGTNKNSNTVMIGLLLFLLIIGGGYYVFTQNHTENEAKIINRKVSTITVTNDSKVSQATIEDKIEAERLKKEREKIQKLRKEKALAQKEELEILRKEKVEREKVKEEAKKLTLDKLAAAKHAEERLAIEEVERVRLERKKAKEEARKLALDKLATEKRTEKRLAKEEAERVKLEKEKASQEFPLTVNTTPSNAKVQILNIKPKYYDGIKLKRGKYKIRVSKNGYKTVNVSVNPKNTPIKQVVLEKKLIQSNKYITKIGNKMWQDQAINARKKFKWHAALKYCKNLSLGGYSDWRLPSIKTLKELYTHKSKLKNVSSSYYWSSATYANSTSYAWYVYFKYGFSLNGNKTRYYYVRCVRGGQ